MQLKVKSAKCKVKSLGFTLIEMLIVIALIGILAAVLIAIINPGARQKAARDAIRKQHVASIGQAAEVYYAENGDYPTEAELLAGSNAYIRKWPDNNPKVGDDYVVATATPTEFCVRVVDETHTGATTKYIRYKASDGVVTDDKDGC